MSSAGKSKARSSKSNSSSGPSVFGIPKGWDTPEDYVNAAVSSVTGIDHPIMTDGSSSNAAVAPSVTVYTNIAGAVAVTVDQAGLEAGLRLRSRLLPENIFNPFRRRHANKNNDSTNVVRPKSVMDQIDTMCIRSSVAACTAAEEIKDGVRQELDRWALQTSRRESTMLWRHECSRYASSSHIGYHPNHPSWSRPGSRPSSTATILRPFSASDRHHHDNHQHHKRATSALTPRLSGSHHTVDIEDRRNPTDLCAERNAGEIRPRSAIPRLGVSSTATAEQMNAAAQPAKRGDRASGNGGSDDNVAPGGSSRRDGSRGQSARGRGGGSARQPRTSSATRCEDEPAPSEEDGADGVYDDIYEDLEEDDGELDNRISIMESRFSTWGRERSRPDSALHDHEKVQLPGSKVVGSAGDRHFQADSRQQYSTTSAMESTRPPRAPPLSARTTSAATTRLGSAARNEAAESNAVAVGASPLFSGTDGARPPRVIRNRPISAPTGESLISAHRGDPTAAVRARRERLELSSANDDNRRARAVVQEGQTSTSDVQHQDQRQQSTRQLLRKTARDITTAVPSWDRHADGGGGRPLSSATVDAGGAGSTESGGGQSRPSSAAFRRWMQFRPSARSAVSAVSSARTLGMDDPELIHLQIEMESRRGRMSEETLARVETHYAAVLQKTQPQRLLATRGKRGRPNSGAPKTEPDKDSEAGKVMGTDSSLSRQGKRTSSGEKPSNTGGGVGSRETSNKCVQSSSPSKAKSGNTSAKKSDIKDKKNKGRSRSPGKRGRRKKKGKKKKDKGKATISSRKVYSSAAAFMAEHFPTAGSEQQDLSVLGMEQLEDCYHASQALARAGVSVPRHVLRRALVIPTDRPLEACLAALPRPLEGLRDRPFPTLPNPSAATIKQTPAAVHLSAWTTECSSAKEGGASAGQPAAEEVTHRGGTKQGKDKQPSSSKQSASPKRAKGDGAATKRARPGSGSKGAALRTERAGSARVAKSKKNGGRVR